MAYYYSPFRKAYKPSKKPGGCPFCSPKIKKQTIKSGDTTVENASYRWVINSFPKFEGHTMLVPKRHVTKIGEETREEILDREELLVYATRVLGKAFPKSGFEVFLQTGKGSESSVAHLHWHVVPASVSDPIRSFDKLGQFYTVEKGKERVVLFPVTIKRSPTELLTALSRIASTKKYRR